MNVLHNRTLTGAMALLVLCAGALAAPPTADGMVEYKDAKHNFKFKYPATWQKTTVKDAVIAFGSGANEIAVTLERAKNVKRTENNLDVIMAEAEIQLRKDFDEVRNIREKTVEFAGFPGRSVRFQGRKANVWIEMNLTFTVAGGEFYMMTTASTADNYPSMEQTFNSITASFELTKKK